MPYGDGTGPAGLGPMTGRGAGYCAGYNVPGYANPYGGRGWGRGFGWGRGYGRGFGWRRWGYGVYPYAPIAPTQEEEKRFLESRITLLENELKAARERLEKLEGDGAE